MLHAESQIQSFLSAHRSDDGWIVYHFCEKKADALFLTYLPDCLGDKYLGAVRFYSIAKEPMMEEVDRIALSASEAPTESYPDKDLKSFGWIGSVEIEWNGSSIHFHSIFTYECLSYKPLILVAARSVPALRHFLSVLAEYGRSRQRGKAHDVLVVDGPNISVPELGWEDLILPPGMADDIRGNVGAFFRSREKYLELGLPYRRGFLFAGPPGCGKTLTVKVLASKIDAKVITIQLQSDVTDYTIARAFDLARKYAPSIVVFEELEKLVSGQYVSLGHFLNLLDGLSVAEGLLIVATSNDPAKLDPALLHRPSRFDRVWKFPLPDYEQRLALLRKRGCEHFSEEVLREVARNSAGFSMAYVQEIVVNALLRCANNEDRPDDGGLLESLDILKR